MTNNQRDPRWANIPVGSGEQTIGQIGCAISVIGNVLNKTPVEVNDALKAVSGFAQQNLVIWDKIAEAFLGTKVTRVWTYNNDDVLKNIPNVIVEVPAIPIGGRGSHWVQYIGNEQLEDPWTGTIRPTSDFPNPTGYCIIIPPVQIDPPPIPTPAEGYSERQAIIDTYKALCGVYPSDDELAFRLKQLTQGINITDIIIDICNGDGRFKRLWVSQPIPDSTYLPYVAGLRAIVTVINDRGWPWTKTAKIKDILGKMPPL